MIIGKHSGRLLTQIAKIITSIASCSWDVFVSNLVEAGYLALF